MQTCSKCNTQNNDDALLCSHCQSDLRIYSELAVALAKYQENPRVSKIVVVVSQDACPACHQVQGTYEKDQVPALPHRGCSHHRGCRCHYQPVLSEIYP